MSGPQSYGKILVVDPNAFFAKCLGQSLGEHGYEVIHCSEAAYALTMIEWNMPVAILCSIPARGANAFEVPSILQADPKTRHIPVIAVGDRRQQSHLEVLRAGYVDFVDRRLSAGEIAAHVLSVIVSVQQGFQSNQMLEPTRTMLAGHFSSVDLASVLQILAQSRQIGALHINLGSCDGILFFHGGEVVHAECGDQVGDEAVKHLVKECQKECKGTYKFVEGNGPSLRTVRGELTSLILGAVCDMDQEKRATLEAGAGKIADPAKPENTPTAEDSPEAAANGSSLSAAPMPEAICQDGDSESGKDPQYE